MENLGFHRSHRAFGAPRRSIAVRLLGGSFLVVWQVVRLTICAVLILTEPLLRATLVPIAFLSFVVTLIFGFLIGDPRFPRWGMLAFSVGTLMLYWLFLGVMSIFMTLPRSHDR
ncbi:hypothetical protein [Variovorax fucosicus]|uniref:hypothetical protein n=1 Tax=Variovorax fucosicus TaxID=3053517 RepID=UPI002574F5C4|nr:hypothetical protein [Variovorax sp. J22G47]MDM0058981.1 hypothetical protein [Variovorax sp. J22G47]